MKDHPLKVYYPYGGIHYLLHWWTYNERGHIVLARSTSALNKTAQIIISLNHDAEIKNYCQVDIVAPSQLMCDTAIKQQYDDRVNIFNAMIFSRLRDVIQAGKTLPPQFVECEEYKSSYEDDDPPDDYTLTMHTSCINCRDKIKLVDMTPGEFYNKYNELPEFKEYHHSTRAYIDPHALYSRADQAQDDEEIWYVSTNFGHHSYGLDLHPVDHKYYPDAAFYFRRLKNLDKAPFEQKLSELKKIDRLELTAHELRRKKEMKLRDQKRIDEIIRIFSK